MLKNKKGFIGMWSDVIKGFFAGLIVGAAIIMLMVFKVIPLAVCSLSK